MPTAAPHVEEPTRVPNRVDHELMNPALEVAPSRSKTMGGQAEDDGDVEERNGEQGKGEPRKPEERHHRGENNDSDRNQPEDDSPV